jgi:hypothetical protein
MLMPTPFRNGRLGSPKHMRVNILPIDILSSQCAASRFKHGMPSFKSHALTTGPPHLLLLEVFSAAGKKHGARDCLNLCPKCTETRLRSSVSSKNFPGVISSDPRSKGEGREGKREGGIKRNERKGMGRKER